MDDPAGEVELAPPTELLGVTPEPDRRALALPPPYVTPRGRIGGSRRSKSALVVVGIAIASAVGGVAVGRTIKSPADAASERAAPIASRITVPIERRALTSSLAVAGEIRYDDPTPIRIAGSVGSSAGENQVITRLPEIGSVVDEGLALFDISGRPVFIFLGTLPTYRSLGPGATGPDVLQFEQALERLGFSPGAVDELYDTGTESAIDAFYAAKGYPSEGPTDPERERLRTARKTAADAQKQLNDAQQALSKGGEGPPEAEMLGLMQALQRAVEGVPDAETKAAQDNTLANSAVSAAVAARDSARANRDAAAARYVVVSTAGAIDPDTSEPYTAVVIAEMLAAKVEKDQALLVAEQDIVQRTNERTTTAKSGERAIRDANDALTLAQAAVADASKPLDTSTLSAAVTTAQEVSDQANADLAIAEAEIGTSMPAGEMVFVPLLPTNLTSIGDGVSPGSALQAGTNLATVSSTNTLVSGRVAKNDSDLIAIGTKVDIKVSDTDVETTGTLTEIRKPQSTADPNDPFGGGGGDTSGRLEIIVTPDDPAILAGWVNYQVRIGVTVSATAGEVLAVPVSAVSVGPDGQSRIEVERRRARGTDEGETEVIDVVVGLSAQGYVEISALGGATIAAGDKVVVGTESGTRGTTPRSSRTSDTTGDTEASG